MAYDDSKDRFLLFGGESNANDTWSYSPDANRWTNLAATGPPPPGYMRAPAMAYDVRANRLILFGVGSPNPNETWAYDGVANAWTNLRPLASPPPRHDAGVAFDVAAGRILLFGGGDIAPQHPLSAHNDTWAYDYVKNSWTQLRPAVWPDRRLGAAMVYDSAADRIVLFGGCANGIDFSCALVNDTWIYDYTLDTWTEVSPVVSPSPRSFAASTYDSRDDAMILFGGTDSRGVLIDTWTYSVRQNRWTNENPMSSPIARQRGAMAYDPVRNQALLFGGSFSTDWSPANDTWSYRLGAGGTSGGPSEGFGNPLVLALVLIAASAGTVVLWFLWRKGSHIDKG